MAVGATIRAGTTLGRYRIVRALGRGGMSTVYEARDVELDRDVALKVLAPALADDEAFITRFRRESRLAAALEHPSVVPVYDAGHAEDAFFIAMRLIRGRDLAQLLAADGPLGSETALALLRPVAAALDAAHALGLVHRDVKPHNILVGDDGTAYLTDFGLAKSTTASAASQASGLVGTVDYVAPEQIAGGAVDGRTDQYALAAVLFECVTGRPPFRRDSELATLWAHVEEVPPLPSALRPAVHAALDEAVVLALAKTPEARLGSCGELIDRAGDLSRPAPVPSRPPFVGLTPFGPDDAAYFFGRERLVRELVERLADTGLVALVGPSGSGKSSLMRAGVLPALARRTTGPAGSPVVIRPGDHPAASLHDALGGIASTALACLAPGDRLVVGVDQLEELFVLTEDETERRAFIRELASLARAGRERATVLVCLRADYFGACAAYPELAALLGGRTVLVGAMSREESRRAIEGPAARAGVVVEPDLTEMLLEEVSGEPGALPLLSTAMRELWERRDGARITLRAYRETGGVRAAVARLAERTYTELAPGQQDAARRILLRLSDAGEHGDAVRRRMPLDELADDEDTRRALAALTRSRLAVVDDGAVEVAHEALFREWPRLRGWLDEDEDARAIRRRVSGAAATWDAGGRDAADLLRGATLDAALEWEAERPAEPNALERALVAASRAAAESEASRQRRANRRLRALLALAAALLVAAAVGVAVALVQRSSARLAADRAEAQRLATLARTERALDRAVLLAREAVAVSDSPAARGALLEALLRAPAAVRVYRPLPRRLAGVAASSSGDRLAVWDDVGAAALVDARSGRVLARLRARRARFTADGRRVIAWSARSIASVDAHSGTVLRAWKWPPLPARARDVAADGRTALAVARDGGEVIGWDTRTSAVRFRVAARPGRRFLLGRFVSGGDRVLLVERRAAAPGVAYTVWKRGGPPRPELVATGDDPAALPAVDESARILVARSRTPGEVLFLGGAARHGRRGDRRHTRAVSALDVSLDGSVAATGGDEGQILVWRPATGGVLARLAAHGGRITGLSLDRRARTLYSAAADGAVVVWDLAGDRRLGRAVRWGGGVGGGRAPTLATGGDGRVLAVPDRTGAVAVRDAATLASIATLHTGGPTPAVAVDASGSLVATAGDDGRVLLWRPRGRARARTLAALAAGAEVHGLVFSLDGSSLLGLVTNAGRGRLLRWRLAGGGERAVPIAGSATDLAVSDDGKLVAVAVNDPGGRLGFGGYAAVFGAGALERRYVVDVDSGYGRAQAVAFSPGGELLATGGGTGEVRVFEAGDGSELGRVRLAGAGWLTSLAFSPDGRTLAAAGSDGAVRLVDVGELTPIGASLPSSGGTAVDLAFSRGGQLFTVDATGDGRVWQLAFAELEAHACRLAGRALTRAEWLRFLHARPYDPACA